MNYCYQRIRDLREDKDKTQSDIAKVLDVHLTQYRRWELGETEIPVHKLIELCEFYKVSVDYILGINNKVQQGTTIGRPLVLYSQFNKIEILHCRSCRDWHTLSYVGEKKR